MKQQIFPNGLYLLALSWLTYISGCGGGEGKPGPRKPADPPMTIKVTSSAFDHNQPIPKKHTADGDDVSPPLSWTGAAKGTRQFVLICDDPDAPSEEPWVHWVLYGIRSDVTSLPEGMPKDKALAQPEGAFQGMNSWPTNNLGYRGPDPPAGKPHHYRFRVYALRASAEELNVPDEVDGFDLLAIIEGKILAQGELVGIYGRTK